MNKNQLKEKLGTLSLGSVIFGWATFPLLWIVIILIMAITMTATGTIPDAPTQPTQTSLVSMLVGLVIVGIAFVIVSTKTMKRIKEQINECYFKGTNLKLLKSKLSELTAVGSVSGIVGYLLFVEIFSIISHLIPKRAVTTTGTTAWLLLLLIFAIIVFLIVLVVNLHRTLKRTKKQIIKEFEIKQKINKLQLYKQKEEKNDK